MSDTVNTTKAAETEPIILGAGEVYMYEFSGNEIPKDEEIETEEHNTGHCSGGFSVDYKPDKYEVKNQYGKVVRVYIVGESCTAKTGILSWNLKKLALLSTAEIKETEATAIAPKKVKLIVGGSGNSLKNVLLRFVHTKADGNKIRFTCIGQGGNGFALEFTTKETTIDAQIEAIEAIKGFLFSLEEEVGEKVAQSNQ